MAKSVKIGNLSVGGGKPLALIAGPCVIEGRAACMALAGRLARLAREESIPVIFKASYDKANRSSARSFRGPGLSLGLAILTEVKERFGLPVLTDVHTESGAAMAGRVVDVVQIPAFLSRQTDLVQAAGHTGKVVNVKKAQFMAPSDIRNVVEKIEATGNRKIMLTERGVSFGYNDLVADMRSLIIMRELGYPVVFDATHSVQKPGGRGDRSGGESKWAPGLARAAVATGCDAVFIETHLRPDEAMSDKENMVPFNRLRRLWRVLRSIDEVVSGRSG